MLNPTEQPDGAAAQGLKPRLLKGSQADYEMVDWPGKNTSGLVPFGDYVLVRMDQCASTTTGGVTLPEELIERMNLASESGVIYATGDGAFTRYDDGRPWTGAKPEAGDRVCVERYAGIPQRGRDDGAYRIMGYRNVAAGMDVSEETEA